MQQKTLEFIEILGEGLSDTYYGMTYISYKF